MIRDLAGVALICAVGTCCSGVPALASGARQSRPATASRVTSPVAAPLDTAGGEAARPEVTGALSGFESDPLAGNGLASPTCSAALSGELAETGHEDCETSGFEAAGQQVGHYGIDVHIEAGFLGLSEAGLMSVIQEGLIAPLWMAMVWCMHALLVMVEWCFTIDILHGPALTALAAGLHRARGELTEAWIAPVLSCAAVLAVYTGIIRRRVADTLAGAIVTVAMMASGLWVINDPSGIVETVGAWSNDASISALAISTESGPNSPVRTLGESLSRVYADTIEAPWCYLEFGNVDWCQDPRRLEPELRDAALKIAAGERSNARCAASATPQHQCAAGPALAAALERSARTIEAARSNGGLFLALPANGLARNAISEPGSLLRAVCRSSELQSCKGPAAAEAEFRSSGSTWARFGGLLLISVGVAGIALLLGAVAVRLLVAAAFALLLLLMAPAVVLAPALGDRGRAVFRGWAGRLVAALLAKLGMSFVLGVVLAVLTVLWSEPSIGWWTSWLLASSFSWAAFLRRHEALDLASLFGPGRNSAGRTTLASRLAGRAAGSARRTASMHPSSPLRRTSAELISRPSGASLEHLESARKYVALKRAHLGAEHQREEGVELELSARQEQLARIRGETRRAYIAGDRRRAIELGVRAQRVEGEITAAHRRLGGLPEPVRAGRPAPAAPFSGGPMPFSSDTWVPAPVPSDGGEVTVPQPAKRPPVFDPQAPIPDTTRRDAGNQVDWFEISDPAALLPSGPDAHLIESPVMRDIREFEAGRKKELGFGNE